MTSSRRVMALVLVLACWLCVASAQARANPFLSPGGRVFTGLTGGSSSVFQREVGKQAAVDGVFVTWGRSFESAFGQASFNHARLMLHISTAMGYGGAEQITPRGIAQGAGDGYLLQLSARIGQAAQPVYIRLLPEMDQANNAYCAFNNDGSSRGGSHSIASFKQAWRRVVLVLRGGTVAQIDARLGALGLPALHGLGRAAVLPRRGRLLVGSSDRGITRHSGQQRQRLLPGRRVRGLGRHRLLQPLPELQRP